MKVNPSLGFEKYQSYMKKVKNSEPAIGKQGGAESEAVRAGGVNTDKVQISQDATARAESGRMAKVLAGEAQEEQSTERIAQLRASVQSGQYYVPTEKLADAILGFSI